jgi:hypothetical protein
LLFRNHGYIHATIADCPVLLEHTTNNEELFRDHGYIDATIDRVGYKRKVTDNFATTRVEAVSNTSTVTLRVVGGDEKGSLKSETVKYGLETKGPQTQEGLHWRGPVAYT